MTAATCTVVRVSDHDAFRSKQGLTCFEGISAESAGSERICMHLVSFPPGGRAKAHLHEGHETTIYVLSGESGMWFGPTLEEHLTAVAGDFLYIPAGVPHLPYNLSDANPCVAVVARTDPSEQESVVLRPDLEM